MQASLAASAPSASVGPLMRNFTLRLPLRQQLLLEREASRRGISKRRLVLDQLAGLLADLWERAEAIAVERHD